MKRMLSVVVACAVGGLLVAAGGPREGEPADPKLEGVWKLTFGVNDGTVINPAFNIHWTLDAKDNVTQHTGAKAEDDRSSFKFALVFDHKKKTVDYKDGDKVTLGIYELKGDAITFCFNFKDKDRPKFIDSNSAYGFTVYRFERVKPAAKK